MFYNTLLVVSIFKEDLSTTGKFVMELIRLFQSYFLLNIMPYNFLPPYILIVFLLKKSNSSNEKKCLIFFEIQFPMLFYGYNY